jgi:hypothetical protein
MSLTSPAHRAQLELFASRLGDEAFATRLVPAAGAIPYDTLLVGITGDEEGGPGWQLELSFLPNLEDQLEGVSLLQCFVALPAEVRARGELLRFAVRLNAKLPLVGFGALDEPPVACFRHTLMLPEDAEIAAAMVVQAAWMISYLLTLFGRPVARVAAGEATIEEALRGHPFAHLFL